MKKIALLLTFLIAACDAPTSRRTSTLNANGTTTSAASWGTNGATSNFGSTSTSSTTTSTSSTTTTTPGYEACNMNSRLYNTTIGSIGVCRSTANTNEVSINFSNADGGEQTCLVPTFTDASSGSSTYIGVAQCTYHKAGETKTGIMNINRSGYTNYKMNSIIIMKYSLISTYFQCMDAPAVYMSSCLSPYINCNVQATMCGNLAGQNQTVYANYLSSCPNTTTSCSTQASQCMNTICSLFKKNNSSKYITISF